MHEQQTFLVPAEDYRQIVEQLDERSLREAYIGRWASREAFGLHLLADTNAARRLAELPRWLRVVVKLDGEAMATEMEEAGVYVIAETDSGVAVFDGAIARRRGEKQE